MSQPKLTDLPASARTIAEVIGIEDTFKLCRTFHRGSHSYLYVPTVDHLLADHEIAQAIGVVQAGRLAVHFGGDQIYIPSPNAERKALLWADFMAAMPLAEIAKKHGLSERRVRQITAEERPGYDRRGQCREIAKLSTPVKAASARRYGTLGGSQNAMIRTILSRFKREPQTPYGTLLSAIHAFQPKLHLLLFESRSTELTVERAVELIIPCLPAELTIKYGDTASLMILKPAKTAQGTEPLMIRVETPLTAKSMSQNSLVIAMLEALAVSAVIDRQTAHSEPVEACNP